VGVTGAPPNFGPRRRVRDGEETTANPADEIDSAIPSAPLVSIGNEAPPAGSGSPSPSAAPPFSGSAASELNAAPTGVPPIGAGPTITDSHPDQFTSDHRYPSSPSQPDAGAAPAHGALGDPAVPDAHAPASEMAGGPPAGFNDPAPREDRHAEFAGLMQSVRTLLDENRLAEAHLQLSEWYGDPHFSPEENAQLTDMLDRLAGTVIYSREHLLERPYEVQPGDTLEKIADAYEVPWQLLANINGIRDARTVRPGQTLKVLKGPFDAYVNLSQFELVLYLGNRYAGRFPIGIGRDQETPEGKFVVERKITNPTYYGQPVIDKDDPNNPLGEYAIDLGQSIWIHGTNDPQSIGRADSRGCIRLGERDIKDLSEILSAKSERTAGSQVTIRR
jgi:LysM repeat protein